MVRQMVGDEVPSPSPAAIPAAASAPIAVKIRDAIESVWTEAGVAILVDLGGAETNSEMAIEMLRRRRAARRCASATRRSSRARSWRRRRPPAARRSSRSAHRRGAVAMTARHDRASTDHPSDRPARAAGGEAHQARQDVRGRDPPARRARRRVGRRQEHRQGHGPEAAHRHACWSSRPRARRRRPRWPPCNPWSSGTSTKPHRQLSKTYRGQPASPGLAIGPLVRLAAHAPAVRRRPSGRRAPRRCGSEAAIGRANAASCLP